MAMPVQKGQPDPKLKTRNQPIIGADGRGAEAWSLTLFLFA
jgi:hypothetical protein